MTSRVLIDHTVGSDIELRLTSEASRRQRPTSKGLAVIPTAFLLFAACSGNGPWRRWTQQGLGCKRPLPRWFRSAQVAAVIVLMTASCGGGDSKVALPSKTISSPALPQVTASSEADAVKAAYIAIWGASDRALTAPAEQIRSILRNYSTGAYLDRQVRQIVLQQAEHKGPWGKVVLHVRDVKVAGSKATVRDCQDASNAGLADTRTNKLIPGTRGPKRRNLMAQLMKGSDGRWRLSDLKQFRDAC